MRNVPLKLTLSLFTAAAIVSGCHCGDPQPVSNKGDLAVLVPDPQDPTADISSDSSNGEATYNFASVFMGQTGELPMKINNGGRGTLTVSSVEVTEGADIVSLGDAKAANPVFQIDAIQGTEVGPGATSEIKMVFAPPTTTETERDYTATLVLHGANTEDGHDTITVHLIGKAVSGVCDIAKLLDWGAVQKGDTQVQTITIRNPTTLEATAFIGDVRSGSSGDAAAFTFTSDSAKGSVTLPPGTQKQVKLAFSPTELRGYFAFVKMQASAQCPEVNVTLQGQGVDKVLSWYWEDPSGPSGNQNFSFVDFGYATPNVTVGRDITFQNFGNSDVTVSQLNWDKNEFKVVGEAGALDPTKIVIPGKSSKKLPVSLTPALLGPRTGTLSFNTTLAKQPTGKFTGKGFGGGPDIDVKPTPTLAFGKVALFSPPSTPAYFTKRRITVQNVGTAPVPPDPAGNLHIQQPTVVPVGPNTSDTSEIAVAIAAGYNDVQGLEAKVGLNTAYVEVTITPSSIGQKSWEVSIPSNDLDEPVTKVLVTADIDVMPPCTYTVSPALVDYGLVSPPAFKDINVNIKNSGQNDCIITNLDIQAGSDPTFSLPAGPIDSQQLTPGQTMTVVVRATPTGTASATLNKVTGALEFYANSQTAPQKLVPLQATIAQACLTIAPSDLDFGTVQVGCSSSTRTFSIYNTCGQQVVVNSISVANGAGYPANTPGVCPGSSPCPEFVRGSVSSSLPATMAGSSGVTSPTPITFTATYKPLDLGADQGTIAIVAQQNGQTVTYIVTLEGKGDTVGRNTDVFSQDSKPKADILLVIDDSCSMSSYQQSIGQNFSAFIQYANAAGVDYNIAVTTTDDDPGGEQGRFVTSSACPEKILTPNTPNVEAKFNAKVNVGTNGSSVETGLSPALKALTAPLINNENAGFLRSDAKLAVVVVSDAVDQSTPSAIYYYNAFMGIKGYKASNAFTFNAIAGFTPPNGPPGCAGYDTGPDDGRYAYLVSQTNGVKDDICTTNWSNTLQQLGKTAFGFRTNFFLNATPDLTGGRTIDVQIDGVSVPPTDSRGATVWTYDSATNSVNFEPSYVPEPGQTMSVSYYVTCY